jgi:hypothetical protein
VRRTLAGFSHFPRWVVSLLARPRLVKGLEMPRLRWFFHTLQRLGDNLIVLYKGLRALLTGDFQRIRNYLARLAG